MVGPGTGVAPFRAFVQERAKAFDEGQEIGKMLLFFGCRKRDEDFLYREEWEEFERKLGDKFEMVKAFSREQKQKVYVQHKMKEYSKEINRLLEEGAYFYICGDAANMARAVNTVLGEIIEQERGLKPGGGDEVVKMLRASNMYSPLSIIDLLHQVLRGRLVVSHETGTSHRIFQAIASHFTVQTWAISAAEDGSGGRRQGFDILASFA
jgi:hypothetical protein